MLRVFRLRLGALPLKRLQALHLPAEPFRAVGFGMGRIEFF
jgi:hypothetical protein